MKCKCDNGVLQRGTGYEYKCRHCDGSGFVPDIDATAISAALIARGTLRKSAPPVKTRNTLFGKRCYYVWRMAQFHGGVDMRMPIGAEIELHGASKEELDALEAIAGELANRYLGSNLRAALVWGRAFGMI